MLYMKLSMGVGASRAALRGLLKRYPRVLVICAPVLYEQWRRTGDNYFTIDDVCALTAISRDDFLSDGVTWSNYDLIVIEDYPMAVGAPRRSYDGLSYLAHIFEEIGNNSIDVIQID